MSWNNVKFDTPLTITAGQELFIGYSYYHEGERYVIGADNTHGFEQGSCYLGYISELENYFDDNSAEMFNLGKLLISGIIGDDISACGNSLTLLGSDLGTYVQRDSPTDVTLEVFNSGWNEVTSVVVTATVDGQEATHTFGLFRPIPAYTSSTLLWEDLTLTDDANVTFEIGNVSNLTNYATRRTLSQDCSVYEGEGFKRKLLLEQFTGQSCSNCPAGVDAIDAFIVGHEEDIVWVAIHSFYLSPGLEDNFYNEAAQFYSAKFNEDGSAPMMTLNRARRTLYFTTEEGPASITAVTTHPMYFAYANNYQNFLDAVPFRGCNAVPIACHTEDGDYSAEKAYEAMTAHLERFGLNFTALFIISGGAASGVLRAFYEHEIKVPEQVNIIAFGNPEETRFLTPPIPTIADDENEMARRKAAAIDHYLRSPEKIPFCVESKPVLYDHRKVTHQPAKGVSQ